MKESSQLILNDIVIIARKEDNFVNATQLCLAGNKQFNDWYRLDKTKELIKELEMSETGIPVLEKPDTGIHISANHQDCDIENDNSEKNILIPSTNNKKSDMGIHISQNSKFIKCNKGGSNINSRSTWIHPDLAIQLAQWISPKFALQVSKWIRTLFTTGTVSLNKLLEEKDHELKLKDNQIQLLKNSFLKKQYRKSYTDKYVIYMVTNEDCKKKRIYIIGKTINLTQRLSNYNKSSDHEVVYYRSCNNIEDMTIIESLVLNKLKIYREQANRDRFILPLNNDIKLFTDIIDDSIKFIIPTV
jgi:hypothetical protein